jgi:hypothetical protein
MSFSRYILSLSIGFDDFLNSFFCENEVWGSQTTQVLPKVIH